LALGKGGRRSVTAAATSGKSWPVAYGVCPASRRLSARRWGLLARVIRDIPKAPNDPIGGSSFLCHEPHQKHQRWRRVGAFGPFAGPPSDPRLRRALEAWPPRLSFARAGPASELAMPPRTRPRSDGSGWGRDIWLGHQRTLWSLSLQPKPYAREQAGLRGASVLAERRPERLTRQAYA
jgi:hypothetical protein